MGVKSVYSVYLVYNFYSCCTRVAPDYNWHKEGKAAHHYVFELVDLAASVHSKIKLTYTS